jgi:hypothetical protein
MKITQVLVEATQATVAFAFGRFNPAHQGHIEVWRKVEESGKNWFVGTNPNTIGPNDPLTFQQKSAWMEEIYPPISGHIVAQTSVLTLAAYIFKKLRNNESASIAYITDDQDWAWSGKLLNQYNGVEGSHGYYKFAQITHVPSPRVSSATALRDAARADDKVAFYHASGTDPKLKVAGLSYFDTVKQACEKYPLPVKRAKKVTESLNEFAPDGFNGGDDGEEFSPEIAKMAQEDGFTKGAGLADGATLERAMAINYWHSQHGGMYKQYFAKGFKAGRMDKIRHNNKQYNLNLQLMKDGSIRHGEQGMTEMDSQGYTGSRDRKSMSTYGSRDKGQVSKGQDVHLGSDSMLDRDELDKKVLDVLNKSFAKTDKKKDVEEAIQPGVDTVASVKKLWQYIGRNLTDLASNASFEEEHSKQPYVEERLVNLLKTSDGKPVTIAFDMAGGLEFHNNVLYIPIGNMWKLRGLYQGADFVKRVVGFLSNQQGVAEDEQKTVAKTWDQMTPQEKISGVKGRTVWNEKTQRYYTVFDVPVKQTTDEASLATMRDYFAGDENARDPYEITKQRLHFSKDKNVQPNARKEFRSPYEYEQWLKQNKLKQITKVKEDEAGEVEHEEGNQLIPFPAGTAKVHVSDVYDWYKLGQIVSDLDDADPKMFGQGAPQTVIAFGSEEEESKLMPLLKRLGLRIDDIDPEGADLDEAYHAGSLYEMIRKRINK